MKKLTAKILVGDNRKSLKSLPTGCVQTVITSPPYWGLRDYGTAVWIGGEESCDHQTSRSRGDDIKSGDKQGTSKGSRPNTQWECKCGATREDEQIGLEKTPADFIEQLCLVFDEIWRVLADDGTVWVNLGDSYKPSGNGSTKAGLNERYRGKPSVVDKQGAPENHLDRSGFLADVKEKELVGVPWRFAFAMQARGWYLRQDIIWAKPNPMPESVTDRCTKSHEYVFLLTKAPRYFFDHEAIKEDALWASDKRNGDGRLTYDGKRQGENGKGQEAFVAITDKRNKRDVWTVSTKPYADAHFATYPPELILPCVLAGSKEGDIVLDPFSGSGTTGEVALKNNRHYIGLELNPDYAKISEKRISNAIGMFGEVEILDAGVLLE